MLDILGSFVGGVLRWIILFVIGFTAVMLLIVGIVKLSIRFGNRRRRPVAEKPVFVETPEYVAQIRDIILLLANGDEVVGRAMELFTADKQAFIKTHLSGLDASGEVGYWQLMIDALESFGYLSHNDWKAPLDDALHNLEPALRRCGIDASVYDAIPEKHAIMEPEVSRVIAAHLPEEYALVSIDTGEDSYAIAVAPVPAAEKAVQIADAMQKEPYITGIRLVKGS